MRPYSPSTQLLDTEWAGNLIVDLDEDPRTILLGRLARTGIADPSVLPLMYGNVFAELDDIRNTPTRQRKKVMFIQRVEKLETLLFLIIAEHKTAPNKHKVQALAVHLCVHTVLAILVGVAIFFVEH